MIIVCWSSWKGACSWDWECHGIEDRWCTASSAPARPRPSRWSPAQQCDPRLWSVLPSSRNARAVQGSWGPLKRHGHHRVYCNRRYRAASVHSTARSWCWEGSQLKDLFQPAWSTSLRNKVLAVLPQLLRPFHAQACNTGQRCHERHGTSTRRCSRRDRRCRPSSLELAREMVAKLDVVLAEAGKSSREANSL